MRARKTVSRRWQASPLSRVLASPLPHADDCVKGRLDLHELTDALSASCYWMQAEGESMTGAGILSGDWFFVDREIEPQNDDAGPS